MIFTQLILVHIIGDFILQPNSWVSDKENKKLKSKYLYLHILLHILLTMAVLWDLKMWWIALFVGVSHYCIDAAKLLFQNYRTRKKWFFIDQLLHVIIILGIAYYYKDFNFEFLQNKQFLNILVAVLFLTTPTSIMIKTLLSAWSPITEASTSLQTESLSNAGKYIGILERLLVFTFIMMSHWEGVGFMIAAKSVFRFSDLAQAKQRKLTEYVLIGTLLSFGVAILLGILIKNI